MLQMSKDRGFGNFALESVSDQKGIKIIRSEDAGNSLEMEMVILFGLLMQMAYCEVETERRRDAGNDEQENFALMAYNNSGSDTEVTSCSKECVESYAKLKKLYEEQREQLGDASIEILAYTLALKRFMKIDLYGKTDVLTYHKKLLAAAVKEKEELKTKLEKWENSSKALISVFDSHSSDIKYAHVYDKFAKVEGMHVVPLPMTGNYMPPGPDREIDESQFTYGPKQSKTSESDTNTSDFNSCESNSSVETLESVPEPVVNEKLKLNVLFYSQLPHLIKSLIPNITQEASGSLEDLEIIQEEDTHLSLDTSLNHEEDDQEINEPQSDINPIHKSTRTLRAPDRMCLHVDAKEHELGDLGEPLTIKLDCHKWLFKKKTDMDEAVYTYKARLVAKGSTQTLGIDYEDNFLGFADIRAIMILIAIVMFYDYEIWQMDVKTAFLNGHLSEEVYMVQPEGLVNLKYPNQVCKLKRSIYGLKQASRQWNKRFDDEIKKFGFNQSHDEPYVMKDLGEATYILGIKIYLDRSRRLIGLCQSAYIEKILKRYFMENSKRGTIPMQEKLKLSKSQGALTPAEKQRMQNVPYASAVGSIMYVVRCELHWTTVKKNILKYLRNTKDMFLVYGGNTKQDLRVSCYTDAGYLTDADDLKSQTGYVFVLNRGVVDWKSIKKKPIKMYCDNTGAIAIAKESGITKGARHYRAKVHYFREVIKFGDVKIEKVHTDDNLADPFTKALPYPKHSELTKKYRNDTS
ncbi:retrotransposon protein, putative, ty1-copia subclass [Tanacetum coccineum]